MNVFDSKPQGLCRQVGSDSLIPTLMLKILRLLKLICDLAQLHLDRAWSSGLRGGLTFPSVVGARG